MSDGKCSVPRWYAMLLVGSAASLSWPLMGYWKLDPRGVGGLFLFIVWTQAIAVSNWRLGWRRMSPAWAMSSTVMTLSAALMDVWAMAAAAMAVAGAGFVAPTALRWVVLALGMGWNPALTRFWPVEGCGWIVWMRFALIAGILYGTCWISRHEADGKSEMVDP